MAPTSIFGNFYYRDQNNKWKRLPLWCKQYFAIGYKLADLDIKTGRFVIAISVPTRAYVASFISAGYIVRSALTTNTDEIESHFKALKACVPGIPVLLRRTNRIYKGFLEGLTLENILGEKKAMFRVRYSNKDGGNLTALIDRAACLDIEIQHETTHTLPKEQKGRKIKRNKKLLTILIGESASHFATWARMDCFIVGSVSVLRQEITTLFLSSSIHTSNKTKGTLLDLLRTKSFIGKGQAYRSDVISFRAESDEVEQTPLVLFDGGNGFVNLRWKWTNSNWVIILDRTENDFINIANLINQQYYQRKSLDIVDIKADHLPYGVEIMAYKEGCF